jgi:hypothetical protein
MSKAAGARTKIRSAEVSILYNHAADTSAAEGFGRAE